MQRKNDQLAAKMELLESAGTDPNIFLIFKNTHSLAPADFSGAVFTCAFFQKMLFLLYKLRNVFLVTNDLSAADLAHTDFCQT